MKLNFRRIIAIINKEFIQIRRDPRTIALILMMPIMQLLLFGYAVSNNVDHVPTAVLNLDIGSQSRKLLSSFSNSQYFDLDYYVKSIDDVQKLVDKGAVKAGIIIPPDYSENIARGKTAQIQLVVDGTDPTTAQVILSSAGSITQVYSTEIVSQKIQTLTQGRKLSGVLDIRPRVWYNPDMDSVYFNIPGLIGIILQNITLMLTSFALVRERERGTLEQLIVTPIKKMELMIGKIVPYIIIGFVDLILAVAIGTLWFKVPITGNILLLFAFSIMFLLGALGVGLFISTISNTQLQAMQLSMFLIMPNILLSGFMFPRDAMPKVIYMLSNFIPLTYFLKVLRGIILKGVGIEYLWPEFMILVVFGVGVLVLAAGKFQKRIS